MPTIREVLEKSEMKTELLMIAINLEEGDELYTKQDAIQDLLKFIDKYNL
ncbi:hypothetical protein V7112_08750 [Bacillus sp. JJ1566]